MEHALDGSWDSGLPGAARTAPEADQNRWYLFIWLRDVAGALGCDDPTQYGFSWQSKILSGKEPYSWIMTTVQIIPAILCRRKPFRGVETDIDEPHRRLSSQCLSVYPESRPSIFDITAILGPAVIKHPFLCSQIRFSHFFSQDDDESIPNVCVTFTFSGAACS